MTLDELKLATDLVAKRTSYQHAFDIITLGTSMVFAYNTTGTAGGQTPCILTARDAVLLKDLFAGKILDINEQLTELGVVYESHK